MGLEFCAKCFGGILEDSLPWGEELGKVHRSSGAQVSPRTREDLGTGILIGKKARQAKGLPMRAEAKEAVADATSMLRHTGSCFR